jgi:hypothetical protein
MKKFFKSLFSDNNDINEKSIVGFASFVVMVAFATLDLFTGYFGKPLVINESIFNSFLILTLGSFGIASVDKYIVMKNTKPEEEPAQTIE